MVKKNTIIKGALILTVAGIITRVIGFVYRIYMSNLLGSEGMGIYQLIFPIYSICYTLCCSGIQTAISKLVAAELVKNNTKNISKIIRISTAISLSIACLLSLAIYINAPAICNAFFKEPRSIMPMKIMTIAIPFMAFTSCIRGYFYGLRSAGIPATSQLVEQVSRMLVIYLTAGFFLGRGLEFACSMAVVGMVAGEIISCLYVVFTYSVVRHKMKSNNRVKSKGYIELFKTIMVLSLPLTISRVLVSILQSTEAILIPSRLKLYGLSHSDALSVYGLLTGMAFPLILFPSVFTNSISLMLLPSVSEAQASKSNKFISNTTSKTLQYSIIIGIISTFLFVIFGNELGVAIYNNTDVGKLLTILAWLCPFIYINTTLHSIINGLGLTMISFKHNTIGLLIRIIFIIIGIPTFGLKGYLWGLLVSFLIITLMDIRKIIAITNVNFDVNNWILKPILAASVTSFLINSLYKKLIFPFYGSSLLWIFIICILMCLIYLALLMIMKSINLKEELNKH